MKRRLLEFATAWGMLFVLATAAAAGQVTITFYHTSDLHEHAAPLARIAQLVQDQRTARKNVVFVDTGDWFNKGNLTPLNLRGGAMAELMGSMRYDAVIAGNHDRTHGTPRLAELVDKHSLPLTAANCTWPREATPANVKPYRVFTFDGVRVAVIGTATPVKNAGTDDLLVVRPIVPAVRKVLAELEGKADIVCLLTHIGVPEDKRLMQALPRLDLILGGHHHKRFARLNYNKATKTILQHSGANGQCIGEVAVVWDGEKIVSRRARLVNVTQAMPEAPAVVTVRSRYLAKPGK